VSYQERKQVVQERRELVDRLRELEAELASLNKTAGREEDAFEFLLHHIKELLSFRESYKHYRDFGDDSTEFRTWEAAKVLDIYGGFPTSRSKKFLRGWARDGRLTARKDIEGHWIYDFSPVELAKLKCREI
jgi:hypothetical protein